MRVDPYGGIMADDRRRSSKPMVIAIAVAVLLGGGVVLASQLGWFAGDSKKADAAATCDEAGDRYEQCVGEMLGPEAKSMVSSKEKDGRAACAADDKTVAMYEECLPKEGCKAFMDCLTDYAQKTLPR